MRLKRRLLFVGLIALGLMELSGTSIAQPADTGALGEERQDRLAQDNLTIIFPVREMEGTPFGFHNWRGFALKDHKSYVLRISIESVRPVEPMGARRFLASNMTIDEIKREISAREGNVTYRGHIKVAETAYWLVNIKMFHDSANLTLNADVADLEEGLTHEIIAKTVGQIAVNTTSDEGIMKGQGELIMIEGPRIGRYQLMLDMDSVPPEQGRVAY